MYPFWSHLISKRTLGLPGETGHKITKVHLALPHCTWLQKMHLNPDIHHPELLSVGYWYSLKKIVLYFITFHFSLECWHIDRTMTMKLLFNRQKHNINQCGLSSTVKFLAKNITFHIMGLWLSKEHIFKETQHSPWANSWQQGQERTPF